MLTYAQNFEDVMLARLFPGKTDGFYVDIGASHPEDLSVTKRFYDLGWSGINVEPIRRNYELFVKERPRDINVNVAIGAQESVREFFEVKECDALSTFVAAQADFLRDEGYTLHAYPIKTMTAARLFEQYSVEEIDFLKIDVEGAEDEILQSLDFRRFRPKVLVIESTKPASGVPNWRNFDEIAHWATWEPRVLMQGYVFAYFDGLNRFYVREENVDLKDCFILPPGCFDGIATATYPLQKALETCRATLGQIKEQLALHQTQLEEAHMQHEAAQKQLDDLEKAGYRKRLGDLWRYTKRRVRWTLHVLRLRVLGWRIFSGFHRLIFWMCDAIRWFSGKITDQEQSNHPYFPTMEGPTALLASALPTISIVTPSFNQGVFVAWTVRSVLLQHYPKLEYIFMDGGSTDDTLKQVEPYRSQFAHFVSEKDKGQSDAIAQGFSLSTGEIMAYLNSDDLLLPGALNFVVDYFQKHPEVDFIYGHRCFIDEHNQVTRYWILPPHNHFLMKRWDLIPQETCFWRRSLFERHGNVDPSFRFAMDYDLFVRYMQTARIRRVNRFLAAFRVHSNAKTSTQFESIGREEIKRVQEHYRLRYVIPMIGAVFFQSVQTYSDHFVKHRHSLPGLPPGVGFSLNEVWKGDLEARSV